MKNLEKLYLNWEIHNEEELFLIYKRLRYRLWRCLRYLNLFLFLNYYVAKKIWILLMEKPVLIKRQSPHHFEEVSVNNERWFVT